ncbi:hypothetical protein ACNI65_06610 [Roseateles sp. So40a]|uniref:hypothetical protein n=1 Tax=Roseateles sp. So40a TaxID=3400226 RepID=UPI003A89B445
MHIDFTSSKAFADDPDTSIDEPSTLPDRSEWWFAVFTRICAGGVMGIALSGFVAPQSATRDVIAAVLGAAVVLAFARRRGAI